MTRADFLALLDHANVKAFLRVLRAGESGQDDSAYTVMYGGSHFESFEDHPRRKNVARGIVSTAAGAYQFLVSTWDEVAKKYGLNDFGPTNQDIGAVALIHRRKALDAVLSGRFDEAVRLCGKEWASLPGSPYGQPTLTLDKAREIYRHHGGAFSAPVASTIQERAMSPTVLFPLLEIAGRYIPQLLTAINGDGSSKERNLAAANVAAQALVEAVAPEGNLMEAVAKLESEPAARAVAQAAIAEAWPMLVEAGGGGIKAARDAAYNPDQVPPWKNPAVWVAAAILPLVYLVAVAVLFGVGGQSWSDDIKTLFVTAVVTGALGSITGFFLGSSLGSQKKDALVAR